MHVLIIVNFVIGSLNITINTKSRMKLCLMLGPAAPGAETDRYLLSNLAASNLAIATSCNLRR